MTTPERSLEEILSEFQKLSLTFVVGEGVVEHHAKLSNFFLETLQSERQKREEVVEKALVEYRQFVLNVLDGIDMAYGSCDTKAIRLALRSRTITQPNNLGETEWEARERAGEKPFDKPNNPK